MDDNVALAYFIAFGEAEGAEWDYNAGGWKDKRNEP